MTDAVFLQVRVGRIHVAHDDRDVLKPMIVLRESAGIGRLGAC